jgi:predicted HTH domain antitoxin
MASDGTVDPGDEELATAVGSYVLGDLSLGRAAERAGMTRWEFEELLETVGFTALYGPRGRDQLDAEVAVALGQDHQGESDPSSGPDSESE